MLLVILMVLNVIFDENIIIHTRSVYFFETIWI